MKQIFRYAFSFLVFVITINLWSLTELDRFKIDLGKKYKNKPNYQSLKIDPSFSFASEDEDSYLKMAVGMHLYRDKFYILDNNLHKIVIFNKNGTFSRSFGEQGKGPGDLFFPFYFNFFDGKMFVFNDFRIDVFSDKLQFQRRVRTFFGVQSFIERKKNFYCSIRGKLKEDLPVILELDAQGKTTQVVCDGEMRDYIYERSNQGLVFELNDQVGSLLINWNKFYLYDPNTRELKKSRIKYELLDKLESWNDREINHKKGNATYYSRMFASAKVHKGSIYVLLRVPWLEILKIDSQGNILSSLSNDSDFQFMRWQDFVVDESDGKIVYYTLGYSFAEKESNISPEITIYRMVADEQIKKR